MVVATSHTTMHGSMNIKFTNINGSQTTVMDSSDTILRTATCRAVGTNGLADVLPAVALRFLFVLNMTSGI